MPINFVYVTCRNKQEAQKIAKILVKEKLIACANIIDSIESIYEWDGKINQEKEAVLIMKTAKTKVKKLTSRIKALHSYECPCIVALPVTEGNAEFISWVKACTK